MLEYRLLCEHLPVQVVTNSLFLLSIEEGSAKKTARIYKSLPGESDFEYQLDKETLQNIMVGFPWSPKVQNKRCLLEPPPLGGLEYVFEAENLAPID